MQRFQAGEEVFVQRFMGSSCEPLRCAVVTQVYGSHSILYDYLVQVGVKEYPVRDEWLVPVSITIPEDLELTDVAID